MSLARRHRQRVSAANARIGTVHSRASTDQADLMGAALHEDYRRLKSVQSIERKIALKRDEILPKYIDYVEGVLEGDAGGNDTVLMTVMVWRFDAGDLDGALAIADYAMRHNLDAPDRYERTTAAIIAEQTAETVLARVTDLGNTPNDHIVAGHLSECVANAHAMIGRVDMHDQIRAKLHKAWGYALRAQGEHDEQAVGYLKRALELNNQVGVKKDIEHLERTIKKAGDESGESVQARDANPARDPVKPNTGQAN